MATGTIIGEHVRRNSTTRERWEAMTPHRTRIMGLLTEARGEVGAVPSAGRPLQGSGNPGPSLCVLGPGNGNDIQLSQLAADFERVVLVDLDEAAIARAVARVDRNHIGRVEGFSPVDLSGLLPVLESWTSHRRPTDAEVAAAMKLARAAPRPEVGTFDVVASTCMLTQLIDSVYMAMPTEHPRCVDLVIEVRNRHLEIMLELLNPGGVGVLVTDFVASETAPELAQLDELVLPQAAIRWIEQRNFFTGANPFAIRDYYNRSRQPGPSAENVQVKGPWRWDIGAKQLAVCAVTFRRRAN